MLVFASPAATAQEARLKSTLDAETFAKVSKMTDSARAESLPVDPLIGVALEGAQRRAPGVRIAGAVHDYLVALRGARAALGADAETAEVVSGAGVLLSGVSPDALRRIRTAGTRRPPTVPLVVLADLIARGVPDTAARAIEAAARANARDMERSASMTTTPSATRRSVFLECSCRSESTAKPGQASRRADACAATDR